MSINNILSSIDRLVEVYDKVDVDQSVYTIEECSEFGLAFYGQMHMMSLTLLNFQKESNQNEP